MTLKKHRTKKAALKAHQESLLEQIKVLSVIFGDFHGSYSAYFVYKNIQKGGNALYTTLLKNREKFSTSSLNATYLNTKINSSSVVSNVKLLNTL